MNHTHDKHGRPIEIGDQVHVVYGGVGHHMEVDRISVHPETRLVQLHGSITVSVPAPTATLIAPESLSIDAELAQSTSSTPKSKKRPTEEN